MRGILSKILNRLRPLLKKEKYQTYQLGKFTLKLNSAHALPAIQKRYALYDKFLPLMSSYIHDGVIFDIGANVGDTLLAMLDKQNDGDPCTFVCVEPDEEYFGLLEENVKLLETFHCNQKVILENVFLSTVKDDKITIKYAGSAKSVSTAQHSTAQHNYNALPGKSIESFSIPELMAKHNLDFQQLQLVKVDTDGSDYDCIMSLGDSLRSASPLIFWEHFFETREQHSAYKQMFDYLTEMQYCLYVIFDNTGHVMLTVDSAQIKQYHEYLLAVTSNKTQLRYGHEYYFDILACKADKVDFVLNILRHYNKFCGDVLYNDE